MQAADVASLIARQRPGWSLQQPFYVSDELFEFERRTWLAKQWYVLAHGSEIAGAGAFIVRDLLGESLLIARDVDGGVRGFYNVCTHRGSRLCDQDGRGARGFTCPYHAWSYRLDGTLRTVAAMPDGVDPTQLSLRPVRVREIGGVILGSLQGDPRELDGVEQTLAPGLAYHGITRARIAARRRYPTMGNWKLVLENFRECYHCFHAHPEYCGVMQWVDTTGRLAPDGGAGWAQTVAAWTRDAANPDSPLPVLASLQQPADPHPSAALLGTPLADAACLAFRTPIGRGHHTQSPDGRPVAPLMGGQPRFDGGVSHLLSRPFVTIMALNDHAVLFHFLPMSAQRTEVIITWLVDAAAQDDEVDIERLVWLWDVTTVQDTRLVERNAAGVRSQAYAPGPYSMLEQQTAHFVTRYLREQSV
jgi:Rieske 2Fe-2S family protein